MIEQQNQDKKPEGGLPFLEWALKHQGWFLAICIIFSLALGFCLVWLPVLGFYFFYIKPNSSPEQLSTLSNFTDFPVFFLAFVVASVTFAVTIWRGYQTYEQIRKAQKQILETQIQESIARKQVKETQKQAKIAQRQNDLTFIQNAIDMATDRENAGRCISGLRVLEDIYNDRKLIQRDRENFNSVALYVLSLPKEGEKKVSSSARQRALDILVGNEFLSQKNLEESEKEAGKGIEIPVRYSTVEKDFSRLNFTRRCEEGEILDLSGFSFRGCDFHGANLSDVNFTNASFLGANLRECDFGNATLTGARLHVANISGTNFLNVDTLSSEQLGCTYLSHAKLPKIGTKTIKNIKGDFHLSLWKVWRQNFCNKVRELRASGKGLPDGVKLEEWDYMLSVIEKHPDHGNPPWGSNT